jgi:hypothetical protein
MRGVWLLLAVSGCTIDVGAVPDASACTASPDFFVSDVWPRYLEANLCSTRGTCHDFDDGHGYLRLKVPEAPPDAGTPLAEWPPHWAQNYLSTIQLLRCDAPDTSRLLTVPQGVENLHPPGPIVRNRAEAKTVIETWVALPP